MSYKTDYWDLIIYIPPEKMNEMASDCGDSYDGNRKTGFSTLHEMLQMMGMHGPPFANQDYSSFGSDKTMETMKKIISKGASIVINPKGEMRIVHGDELQNREKDN